MTTPYRAVPPHVTPPPPLPDPPLTLREWPRFLLSRLDSIAFAIVTSSRYLRRLHGGRWAFIRHPWMLALDADGRLAWGSWANLSECPVRARWHYECGTEDRADDTVTAREIRSLRLALIAEHREHCTCEVWP